VNYRQQSFLHYILYMDALRAGAAVHAVARELAAHSVSQVPSATALRSQAKAIVDANAPTPGAFVDWILSSDGGGAADSIDLHSLSLSQLLALHKLAINQRQSDEKSGSKLPPTSVRCLSYDSIARSRTTLADFSAFYFGYHGLGRADFFKWLPQLVFVEACIYQLDEDNERACLLPEGKCLPPDLDGASSRAALHGVLESRGLLSGRVQQLLSDGERYWALERALCAQMRACEPVSLDEVYACSSLKSFDYRCLHAMLCVLSGRTASDALLRFLEVDEVLTDMADDLFDYEKDVRRNSFNVLRGCVHAVGASEAPLRLAAKIGELEREHEALLAALPQAVREAYCSSRRDAMRVAGSEKWRFPPVLTPHAEAAIRAEAGAGEQARDDVESEIESDAEPVDAQIQMPVQAADGGASTGASCAILKKRGAPGAIGSSQSDSRSLRRSRRGEA
jgi:hypothetical protein